MNDQGLIPVPCLRCNGRVFIRPGNEGLPTHCEACKPFVELDRKIAELLLRIVDLEVNSRLDRDRISQLEDQVWVLNKKADPV